MTLFSTLMARMGQRLLQQYYYPDDLEWHWSLSHCQGDGCACFGTLDNAALQQLFPALAERQSLSIKTQHALASLLSHHPVSVSLTTTGWRRRSTHSRDIQVEIVDFPKADEELYPVLYQALRQDIDSLCADAKRWGYQLLDALLPPRDSDVLFERQTRHFALRAIAEANDDMLDPPEEALSSWDETLDLLLHHGARLLTLRLELLCLTTGERLAQDWQSTVLIAASQPVRQWFDRDCLPELIQTAREAIHQRRLAYQAIRSVA